MISNTDAERIEKAGKIYEKIAHKLDKKYQGKIIAIEENTGDYFVGNTELEACEKGQKNIPAIFLSAKE